MNFVDSDILLGGKKFVDVKLPAADADLKQAQINAKHTHPNYYNSHSNYTVPVVCLSPSLAFVVTSCSPFVTFISLILSFFGYLPSHSQLMKVGYQAVSEDTLPGHYRPYDAKEIVCHSILSSLLSYTSRANDFSSVLQLFNIQFCSFF